MDIHIKYTNIDSSPALENYVTVKIKSLEKFVYDIAAEDSGFQDSIHAWTEIGKIGKHHKEGRVWYAECQIRLPGKSVRATSTHFDIRLAIDEVKEELKRLLKKYKEKQQTIMLRSVREIKKNAQAHF